MKISRRSNVILDLYKITKNVDPTKTYVLPELATLFEIDRRTAKQILLRDGLKHVAIGTASKKRYFILGAHISEFLETHNNTRRIKKIKPIHIQHGYADIATQPWEDKVVVIARKIDEIIEIINKLTSPK